MGANLCNRNLARFLFIVLTLLSLTFANSRDAYALNINSGASYTNNPQVTLQLSMPPYTTQVAVSNEEGTATTFSPTASITWTLSAGDGLKTVNVTYTYSQPYSCTVPCGSYCCSEDTWGNCTGYCTSYCTSTCYNNGSSSVSDTITLDARSVNTGATPVATATNPLANKIYVANQGSNSVTVIDGASNATATVAAGMIPKAIAFNPATNKVYVANSASNDVTVIDGATNTTATVAAGTSPRAIAVNPVTNRIYVANEGSNSVTVINGATNEVLMTLGGLPGAPVAIAVNTVTNRIYTANQNGTLTVLDGVTGMPTTVGIPGIPVGIAVNPVTNRIYVISQGSNTLTVINGANNSPTTFGISGIPFAVAVNPVSNKIFVANQGSNTLTKIDGITNSQTSIPVGTVPYAVALNLTTNKIHVANHDSNTITVVDGITNATTTVSAGVNPSAVGINPITNKAYVLNKGSGNVIVVDGAANSANTIPAGSTPRDVAVNMSTNKIYVLNAGSNSVTVIDGATGTATTVGIPWIPVAIAANPITNRIYVAVQGSNTVTIIDGVTNGTTTIGNPGIPVALAINPVTNRIYVSSQGGNAVAVIDGKTGTQTTPIAVPGIPGPVAVNPVTNKIYVINYTSNAVMVIDGATSSTSSVPVGTSPYAVAANPVTNKIYVANQDSNNVTVIDGATNTTTTVTAGTTPRFIAVNPISNRVYVANYASNNVTIIDGATNTTKTVTAGTNPQFIGVNPVSNKIYVVNNASNDVTMIDGITNIATGSATGSAPAGIGVNSITGRIYIANSGSGSVSEIIEQLPQANPLTTAITALASDTINIPAPSFSLSTNNAFAPSSTGALTTYYQLDTWQGPWLTTQPTPPLTLGLHTVYAFAADAQAATSTNTGPQSSPLTGTMTAYQFLVVPNEPPVITEGASTSVNMSKNGTPTAFNLILHASDANSDTLTWSISGAATNGTATAGGTGSSTEIAYTPIADNVGPDSFVVQVNDGKGGVASITVNVTVIQTYTVSFASNGNGTLTGTTSQTIDSGASTSQVTAEPSAGYYFVNWTGTGGFVTTTANPLTISNITAEMTITANFAPDPVNGTCGSSNGQTFTAAPSTDLCTAGAPTIVTGSGPWVWNCTGAYGGTTADCSASIKTWTVTPSAGVNGSINPDTPQTVNHGATIAFTVIPLPGYHIVGVDGTCGGSLAGDTYTTGAVTADCTVDASFAVDMLLPMLSLNMAGTGTGTVAAAPAGASGTPHNGTLINDPAWTTGRYANGLNLSNSQYVSVPAPTPDVYNITGDLTVAMWINPNSVSCSGTDPGYALISKRSANRPTPYELYIVCGGSLNLHYWGTNIQFPNFTSTGTITTGSWQHVVATRTFSGSNATVTFYINGVEAGTSTQNTGDAQGSPDPVWLSRDGYHTSHTTQGSYSGMMDEVQIYNRAVSASEAAQTYTNNSDALLNRVGNWKLDESSGTMAADTVTLSCSGNCSDIYASGSVVSLGATPAEGSVFSGWSGNSDCSDGSVTMDADKSCTATFNLLVNGVCGASNGGTFTAAPTGGFCTDGTPTAVTGSGPWAWSCTGLYGGTTADCAASIQTYTLTITKSGTGTGTVTSDPASIECGATCSATLNYGTTVVLSQAPVTNSGFNGWGGACGGTGVCAFNMSSDKSVSANFIQSPMVKNQRTGLAYSLLQTACSEASDSDTIMALTVLPAAGLTLDGTKSLVIEGGYNPDYAACIGLTPVFGPVTITSLTTVSGLAIRPVPGSTNAITAFSFSNPAVEGVVDEALHSIAISVPSGTDVTALSPTIIHNGANVSPASGVPQNFTNPVVYTVTAEDLSSQDYTVTVQFVEPYILPTTAIDVSLGAKGVLVDGNRAYVVEETAFKVLDVSNPLSPTLLGSVPHEFTDMRVDPQAIYNNIVWMIRSSAGGYGEATYVSGVDVSDPANPVVRGSLTLQTETSLLSNISLIYSGYLLVHDYSDNLVYVINISNPDAPALYSQWGVPNMVNGGPGNMLIEGSLLYLPCGENKTFKIYNLTNLSAVSEVGTVSTGSGENYGTPVKIGSYVYVPSSVYGGPFSLKVIDVSNPASPTIVNSTEMSARYFKERNGKLFSFDISTPTVRAYSLSNPTALVLEASSDVAVPAPSTSLTIYPMTSPAAKWVGDYLIGMTWGSSVQYIGARALYFPVN